MRIVSSSPPTPNVTRTHDLLKQVMRLTTRLHLVVYFLLYIQSIMSSCFSTSLSPYCVHYPHNPCPPREMCLCTYSKNIFLFCHFKKNEIRREKKWNMVLILPLTIISVLKLTGDCRSTICNLTHQEASHMRSRDQEGGTQEGVTVTYLLFQTKI